MQNSCDDYRRGVDTEEYSHGESPIVLGLLTEQAMRRAALLMFAAAFAIGMLLAWLCGWPVLIFAFLGILGGYGYTGGALSYKYIALGPVMVFLLMGVLMVLASYYIQTGGISWEAFWLGAVIGFPVTAIMHANDIRDIEHDRSAGITTLAMRLGLLPALKLYAALIAGAYGLLFLCVALSSLPYTALLPCLLLPRNVAQLAALLKSPSRERLEALDGITAKFHCAFGLLLVTGVALPRLCRMVQEML